MIRYFGGKYEETIRFIDKNGVKQDVLTAFDSVPTKAQIDKRRFEIIEKYNKVDVVIDPIIKPSISPYEASLKMKAMVINPSTTWEELTAEKSIEKIEVVKC